MHHRFYHKQAHHGLFASGLVAAAGAVAVARGLSVGSSSFPIVVIGIGALEVGVIDIVGMIIDHIEDDGDTSLVKSLHHLLELADATQGVVGVGAVATLRHIIVHRVVAPVVLWLVESSLVHRAVIITG